MISVEREMKKNITLILFFLTSLCSSAQQGGKNVFSFLALPIPARTASLGGTIIAIKDDDVNLALQNPSVLNGGMNNQLSLSHVNYISDINYLTVVYANSHKKIGHYAFALQKVGYGQFQEANEYGEIIGNFRADDYSLNMSIGRDLDSSFSYGLTLKTIYSKYYNFSSFGNAIDAGITYHNRKKLFTAAIVARNFGYQWKTYSGNEKEKLPGEVLFSVSKKVAKAPFRLIFLMGNLQQWDLTYPDNLKVENTFNTGDNQESKEPSAWSIFGDKLLRHVIIANEFILTKNFNIRLGFDFRKQKEFKLTEKAGVAGLSFGFGLKISKFQLSYGFAKYHAAGNSNHFTVTTNLSSFQKKKKVNE